MLRLSRCLYCGCKLNWLKWLKKENFCSDEHDAAYRAEADLRLVSRLHQSASPDYGMTSWKYADNSGYPTPDLSSQPPQCRAETGADVPNLATLARVVYPEAPQIPPRLLVAAPESQK